MPNLLLLGEITGYAEVIQGVVSATVLQRAHKEGASLIYPFSYDFALSQYLIKNGIRELARGYQYERLHAAYNQYCIDNEALNESSEVV